MIRPPAPKADLVRIDRTDLGWRSHGDGSGGAVGPWILLTPLDNVPRALFRLTPKLPTGIGADSKTVILEFLVGKDGTVAQARVIDSTDSSLDEPCLRAVKLWRFEPGLRNNRPVAFRMRQAFVFTEHD